MACACAHYFRPPAGKLPKDDPDRVVEERRRQAPRQRPRRTHPGGHVSSGAIQSNARSLGKLNALLANGGEVGGFRLVSEAAVKLALSEPLVRRDDCWRVTVANTKGDFFDFGTLTELMGMPNEAAAAAQQAFVSWAGKVGSLFLFDPYRNPGFAWTMNGMIKTEKPMNGGASGPRTSRLFDVLKCK